MVVAEGMERCWRSEVALLCVDVLNGGGPGEQRYQRCRSACIWRPRSERHIVAGRRVRELNRVNLFGVNAKECRIGQIVRRR